MQTKQQNQVAPSVPFTQFIAHESVCIKQLMLRPQIQLQIRQQMYHFLHFCSTHRQETQQLITRAFLTNQFESQQEKQISSKCNQVLTSGSPNILQIFIKSKQSEQTKKDNEMIDDQVVNGMEEEQYYQEQQQKYEYLIYLLQYLNKPTHQINLSSLGEILKLLNNIIQNDIADLYQFFKFRKDILDHLINLGCQFAGIADTLGKIVSEETQANAFRDLKEEIVEKVITNLKNMKLLSTEEYTFILDFVQALFNRSKFRNEEVQDIVYITQRLVQEDIVNFFITNVYRICKDMPFSYQNENILKNSLQYLLILSSRIEADDEADMFCYDQKEKSKLQEPTMQFQVSPLLKLYQQLFTVSPSLQYKNITRLNYFEFLLKISNNRYFADCKLQSANGIVHLMKIFKNETSFGLVRVYILQLIQLALHKKQQISSSQALRIVSSLGPIYNILKIKECQGFINKVVTILFDKNQAFANHYKQINVQGSIQRYTDIVGSDLPFVQNRKGRAKQLQFLQKYEQRGRKSSGELCSAEQDSQIIEEFELQLPKSYLKPKSQEENSPEIHELPISSVKSAEEEDSQQVE